MKGKLKLIDVKKNCFNSSLSLIILDRWPLFVFQFLLMLIDLLQVLRINTKRTYVTLCCFAARCIGTIDKMKNEIVNASMLFSCWVLFDSLWPHELKHTRLPYPSPSPRVCSDLCPLSWWCHPTISSFVVPFSSCLQSFPASGPFLMSWLFASGDQSIGASASASVLPVNVQGLFPLGRTGLISLQSKRLSRVFSNSKFESINFSALNLPYGPALTFVPSYWKSHDFEYMHICQQNDVSAF